jgi:hypothetical protein
MAPVGMYQATTKKAVPLVAMGDCRGIKYKILHGLLIVESTN